MGDWGGGADEAVGESARAGKGWVGEEQAQRGEEHVAGGVERVRVCRRGVAEGGD